jgi:hypothetical protein
MKLLEPFRQNDRPPCDCDWCKYSRIRRSMTWTVRVFPRAMSLLVVATLLVVSTVGLVTSCERDQMWTEGLKLADEQAKASVCVDETTVIDEGSGVVKCRLGSHAEVKATAFGSRQVVVCRCGPAASAGPQE